ncbi:MAG: hypothetical protein AAFO77_02175 [Pseudomonadota bacterium]
MATFLVVAPTAGCAFGQKYGQVTCETSAVGQCDQINDKTLLYRDATPRLVYYAPNGTYYTLGSTTVTTGRWWVDETGQNLMLRTFGAGTFPPQPMNAFLGRATEVIAGDPAGLADNKRGLYLLPLRDAPTNEIIEQVRGR